MKIQGKIKVIMDAQTFESGFKKREFVITTQEQYPQDIKFEVYKDKCSLLDSLKIDQEVEVSFNLRGNEYQGKYFVNINAWKIELVTNQEQVEPQQSSGKDSGADDDLPF